MARAAPYGTERPFPLPILLHALGQGRQLHELLAVVFHEENTLQLRSRFRRIRDSRALPRFRLFSNDANRRGRLVGFRRR